MRIFKLTFYVLCLSLLMTSCKKEHKSTQMQNVVAIHDELMPKMSTIGSLINQLNNSSDSLQNKEAVKALKSSHNAMMMWMHDFGKDFNTDEVMRGKTLSEEKKKLLDIQEEKVSALKVQIDSSIENAKVVLNKSKNQQ